MSRLLTALSVCLISMPAVAALDRATLNAIDVYIGFEASSGYNGHPDQQDEVRRGLDMGFRMWQTIIPDLQVRWTNDPAAATVKIIFGDFRTVSPTPNSICAGQLGWSGCEDGNTLWMNDGSNMPFDYDAHTFIDRKSVYEGYLPATYPPMSYNSAEDPGFTTGYFTVGGVDDASFLAFHEFGHYLGMSHLVPSLQQWSEWYGKPRDPATSAAPDQPAVYTDRYVYPGLPVRPQVIGNNPNVYFGGGTPDHPWVSGLNQLHVMSNCHFTGAGHPVDGDGIFIFWPPEGMNWPPIAKYNSRIVYPLDVNPNYISGYNFDYPLIQGLIRMESPTGTPPVYLTSDWSDALKKSKQDQVDQTGGYFVTGIYPRIIAKPKVAAGLQHTLAVRKDGTLWAWGLNAHDQLGLDKAVTASSAKPVHIGTMTTWASVAAGDAVSFGLTKDGTLYSWGSNVDGQLGNGSFGGSDRIAPDKVCKNSGPSCYGNHYVSLSVGSHHVLALKNDGTVWAWGRNGSGQLGDGTNTDRSYPVQIWGRSPNRFVAVSAGANHSVALTYNGNIMNWGSDANGQLGQGGFGSTPYPGFEATAANDWTRICAGRNHTLAMKTDGSVWGWGDNSSSQLGNGGSAVKVSDPVAAQGEGTHDDWSELGAGTNAGGGIQMDGKIYTWGANDKGQSGAGSIGTRTLPGTISGNSTSWTSFAMGYKQCFAAKTDGSLWAWGENTDGELGINSSGNTKNTPQKTYFSFAKPTITVAAIGSTQVKSPATFQLATTASPNTVKVDFYSNGTLIGTATAAPFSFTWSNVLRGKYVITAKATDKLGTSTTATMTPTLHVFDLSGWTFATAPTTVNLTTIGTADWGQWGLGSASDYNHKATGKQIFQMQETDGEDVLRSSAMPVKVTWSDGTPTGSGSATHGITGTSFGYGYEINAKPSTTKQTFTLYLNVKGVDVEIGAGIGFEDIGTTWQGSDGTRAYSFTTQVADASMTNVLVSVRLSNIRVTGGSFTILGMAIH